LGLAALLATAAIAAAAPAPAAVDRDNGVRFELEGTVLTVSLLEPDFGDELWGKQINAVCSPTFVPREVRRKAVHTAQLWPDGATELSYTFDRDVSEHVKWCLLEDADEGGDVAEAAFEPFIRVFGDTPGQRRAGRRLRRLMVGNAGDAEWIWKVHGIVVQPGSIAVTTELRRTRRGKGIARRICAAIETDPAAGSALVFGHDDVRLRSCRAR
jgi:hypothetical protein